ncbi:uncharacterized protein LOC125375866 isoform X1 [Haliotis rufescens]|uniref:uncharacterized protein LOC125375866 isoform X1 n=1 Tax=Haliotis rufescens TaxID=6454 RepID=UPI00201F8489|nr:uncharacterized protein LOC125375866 isoform X1 [Haliotis rufescens]
MKFHKRLMSSLLLSAILSTMLIICVNLWFKPLSVLTGVFLFRDLTRRLSPPTTQDNSPCIHDFLKSVEPTVDLEEFCGSSWNRSDILCEQFFFQNGLTIKDNCLLPKDNNIVPRIVYYVIFSPEPGKPPLFLFMHYLSVVSARRFISPWAIYVISDAPPYGYWWTRVLNDVRGVRFVFRPAPRLTPDKLAFIQHASDIVRLQALIVNGGIYLDTDMLILRPIDALLNISLTMGLIDDGTGMGNAFIVAERNSGFLREWYSGYRHYNKSLIFENSLWAAKRLWLKRKESVNEIASMIYRPNWFESAKLFKQSGYDWKSRYGVHIWHRHGHVPENPDEMNKLNTTLGEIFRFVYYGSEKMVQ